MGITLHGLGQYEEAITSYKKAIEINPDFAGAHNNLGNVLKHTDKCEEAVIAYKIAIELQSDYVEGYVNLGITLNELNKHKEAIISYKKAIEINPDFTDAHDNLAITYDLLHQYKNAIIHFDIARKPSSKAQSLECLYKDKNYTEFTNRLNLIAESDKTNIRVAAASAFITHQLKQSNPYPFCKNPLHFFHVGNLVKYTGDVDRFVSDIIIEAKQEYAAWEPKNKTTVLGFQTPPVIFQAGAKCAELKTIIMREISFYYSKFSSENCLLISSRPKKHTLNGWYVRLVRNGHQKSHIHPGGWLRGVIYLKTIEAEKANEGAIEVSLHGYDLPILKKCYPKRIHRPKKGDILLFPSSLFHKTIPFTKDTDRCVIAFDLIPIK